MQKYHGAKISSIPQTDCSASSALFGAEVNANVLPSCLFCTKLKIVWFWSISLHMFSFLFVILALLFQFSCLLLAFCLFLALLSMNFDQQKLFLVVSLRTLTSFKQSETVVNSWWSFKELTYLFILKCVGVFSLLDVTHLSEELLESF